MGIGFIKLQTFAEILRLELINKTNYYEHRGDIIFPEVHSAWKKNQRLQINEIQEFGRSLYLAGYG